MTAPLATATRPLLAAVTRVETWFADRQHALHGLSASRILVGTAVLGILVTNFGMRHVQWGPASQWIAAYRADTGAGPLDAVFGTSSTTLFTLADLAVMALAVAVVLGWRTRLTTALLVVGLASIVERNALIGDQGDNIARIGLLLMVFMNTSAHWSLDARRRRRHAGRRLGLGRRVLHGLPVAPPWLANPVHNAALLALALQLSILYTASALYKVQGEPWQDGTALYHPLSLHEYAVFPQLNRLLTHSDVVVVVGTYVAVFVQLFFAVGLLHHVTRRVALVGVILMHLGIAVLMGLPWFSLSMIAFDSIFVSSATFASVTTALGSLGRRLRPRPPSPPAPVRQAAGVGRRAE